ncbi:ectoine/hydroxyectoine ABC transporter permease subunit EhuC [Sinorhizobium mexicanum]|uniref:Ectoine/hydroxyectoine ABC transporter permease subunit EhuC n=1 Tax=Sinorhizobium mexicanum TaxID=375549 RepID=A0A859QV95_9HYPH|nr:ectoine/hydroxyectoine ABC transporter permease subunit EhuC [Sinorhizobium mexicanum]MBP1885139.1 polar amino acid transport system permease protein [Sinorhizobium mexicanum]QLL64396.1 ectoine/hydroxyectoine ABC transporter permease subunit EhuC [Sinorhizobium mexicanum]
MDKLDDLIGYATFILKGATGTIELTIYSCAFALLMAMVTGIALVGRPLIIRSLARIYVEVFRGTSLFVQLFGAYFVLPLTGISLSPVQAGVLAIGLNGGAYGAEVVRSAIEAVGSDQREATIALNLTRWQAMRWVIIPQAMVLMLPSFGNLAIEIMKATAVTSLITVTELTFQAQTVRMQTGQTALPFMLIFFTYLILASALIAIVRKLERMFGRGMVTQAVGA